MRKWLAGKLFELAAWLDWDAVLLKSVLILIVNRRNEPELPKRKAGRPLGAKDKKPRKSPVRKAARPIPVANACTGATPYDEAMKRAFPRESKSKPKV